VSPLDRDHGYIAQNQQDQHLRDGINDEYGTMAAGCDTTLQNVLLKTVGATTNAEFAALFLTLVIPANFVFLVWPLIAFLQLITVTVSALLPGKEEV